MPIRGHLHSVPWYRISTDAIETLPELIAAVVNNPTPTCLTEVESFLGIASYLQKFVPRFASTAAPLADLTKKDARFVWETTQQDDFQALKQQLTCRPVQSHFNEDWTTKVLTDASQAGLEAVLMQRDPSGKELIVAYASRKLSDAERHYHSNELECLAIVWSVDDKFRHYVFGNDFTVVTDNAAMNWMFGKRHLKHQIARWIITLQEYTYHERHHPGALKQVADALSRHRTGDWAQSRGEDSWILFVQVDVDRAQRDGPHLATIIGALNPHQGIPTLFFATEHYIAACGSKTATKNTTSW